MKVIVLSGARPKVGKTALSRADIRGEPVQALKISLLAKKMECDETVIRAIPGRRDNAFVERPRKA
jgi:hypothetical protein